MDEVTTKQEIDERDAYIDKVWKAFPDLCRAITESETNPDNGWVPTMDHVAEDMITNDVIVRKAIDSKIK